VRFERYDSDFLSGGDPNRDVSCHNYLDSAMWVALDKVPGVLILRAMGYLRGRLPNIRIHAELRVI